MKREKLQTRSERKPPKDMTYRTMAVRLADGGGPVTLNIENRSFEVIGASEAPCDVYDYQRGEIVPEVLLMDGCEMPASRQVPLLDSHNRWDTASVLGSYRDMKTAGDELIGRVYFSSAPEAESPYAKAREGHLTDFSVGYRVISSQWVPAGEKATIRGRSFVGPVRVTTRWKVRELSICPIWADERAKARSEQANQSKHQGENSMDPKLRAYLEKRGLAKDADETAAWAFFDKISDEDAARSAAGVQPSSALNLADVDKMRREATGEERERIISIDAICKRAKREDLARDYIAKGTPVNDVRRELMDLILNAVENDGGYGHRKPVDMGLDERDKFRAVVGDALSMRCGMRVEKPASGASDLRGYSLLEIARHSLRVCNLPIGGNVMEMVGRALTTSDFPYILGAVANKSLKEGWDQAEETWSIWCGVGSVNDFKTHTAVRAGEVDTLDQIPDTGKYNYSERDEEKEQYSIATYGKLLAITRQAIINDDVSALADIPRAMGEAAARTIGDLPYAVLTANAAMGDGVALFATGHSNYVAHGSGAVPGVATIGAGILAMGVQTDIKGLKRLNIRPEYFLAPKALEGTAEVFFRSERFSDNSTVATDSTFASTRVNPYAGTYFTRVYDARLDASDAAQWYLAARKGKTVKVFFLNGIQEPYMESKEGWRVDGIEFKVRIDAGAKAMDWRGLYCNNGN